MKPSFKVLRQFCLAVPKPQRRACIASPVQMQGILEEFIKQDKQESIDYWKFALRRYRNNSKSTIVGKTQIKGGYKNNRYKQPRTRAETIIADIKYNKKVLMHNSCKRVQTRRAIEDAECALMLRQDEEEYYNKLLEE